MIIFNSNFGGELFMSEQNKINLKLEKSSEYLLTQKCSLHG